MRHEKPRQEAVIFVVEDDRRTREFICILLKYSATALVVQSPRSQDALIHAREFAGSIDLLISDIDLADIKSGMDLTHAILAGHPSSRVLLMSGRELPPWEIPSAWRYPSIPFPTATFLSCVDHLCGSRAGAKCGA